MKKYIILIITSIALFSCMTKTQETKQQEEMFDPSFLQNIEIGTVVIQNMEQQLKLTGKVDYDLDRIIRYISLVDGTVVSTHFHLGDRVESGQTMAVIRSAELSEMEAERKSLEAEIKTLTRELESVQSMHKDNLASQKDLLEAQSRLKQAEASLEKVGINLSLHGSSGSDGMFVIKSPIGGFVVSKDVAAGMPVAAASDPLFVVADISQVWIVANVYAGNLEFVKEGIPVEIRTRAYPDRIFHGKIDVMSQVFDSDEHVLKARIIMPNADLRLKPKMAVDLTLRDSSELKMAVVPSKALIFDDNRYFVVRQADHGFAVAEVKLHSQTDGTSYIEAGLDADDRVVVKGNLMMYSKLKEL